MNIKKNVLSALILLAVLFGNIGYLAAEGGGTGSTGNNTDSSCTAGGPGSSSCSVSWNMGGLGFNFSASCEVSGCESPNYACCGPNGDNGEHTCVCKSATPIG